MTTAGDAPPGGALVPLPAPHFSLALTLECGQVFHWVRHGAGYVGTIDQQAAYLEQRGEELWVTAEVAGAARHYFALDHPLEEICATLPGDEAMQQAAAFCRGLRIIRQPAWECLATFITSSMKQVAHIAGMSHAVRRRFGAPRKLGELTLYAYPGPERLAEAAESELRSCSLGWRAENLRRTAGMVARGEVDLTVPARLPETEARELLRQLPGVGTKVANCALLFGWEKLRAFPIDVWIERALRELYFPGRKKVTRKRLEEFAGTYFGPWGGYAQQYLFHYARTGRAGLARGGRRPAGEKGRSVRQGKVSPAK